MLLTYFGDEEMDAAIQSDIWLVLSRIFTPLDLISQALLIHAGIQRYSNLSFLLLLIYLCARRPLVHAVTEPLIMCLTGRCYPAATVAVVWAAGPSEACVMWDGCAADVATAEGG